MCPLAARSVDANGAPVEAYACQVLENGIGLSLGAHIGYHPLEPAEAGALEGLDRADDAELGVTIEYSGGHLGCSSSESSRFSNAHGVERATNITFLCDPEAGRGFPRNLRAALGACDSG